MPNDEMTAKFNNRNGIYFYILKLGLKKNVCVTVQNYILNKHATINLECKDY